MRVPALLACSVILLSAASAAAEDNKDKKLPDPNMSSYDNVAALASQGIMCPTPPPPPKVKPKAKYKKPASKPVPAPVVCPPDKECAPTPTPQVVIQTVVQEKVVYVDRVQLVQPKPFHPRLYLGAGWMAMGAVPVHQYAWQQGPELMLRVSVAERVDAFMNFGVGLGDTHADGPGKRRSFMAQTGVEYFAEKHPYIGLSGSLYVTNIGFKNSLDSELIIGAVPGLVLRARAKVLSFYFQPGLLIGAGVGSKGDIELALGMLANAGLLF